MCVREFVAHIILQSQEAAELRTVDKIEELLVRCYKIRAVDVADAL